MKVMLDMYIKLDCIQEHLCRFSLKASLGILELRCSHCHTSG
jgi:hypothetical protein